MTGLPILATRNCVRGLRKPGVRTEVIEQAATPDR